VKKLTLGLVLGCGASRLSSATAPAAAEAPAPPPAECAAGPAGTFLRAIDVRGRKRTYTVVAPPAPAGVSRPLVFVLHGHGGDGARIRRAFGLEAAAGDKALFVYPDAIQGWDLDTEASTNRDVAFFDDILARTAIAHCVDTRRVFVAGFSNGAYMANQLACRRGDRIRGVASYAGGGPYELAGRYDEAGHLQCQGKPVAALVVHGLADTTVLPSEGNKSLAHWSAANRCAASLAPGCRAASGCTNAVVACGLPGLGHELDKEAARRTWSFFEAL